jgi:hypothetical protein
MTWRQLTRTPGDSSGERARATKDLVRQVERLPAQQVNGDRLVTLLDLHGADVVVANQELLLAGRVFQKHERHGRLPIPGPTPERPGPPGRPRLYLRNRTPLPAS